MNALSLAKTRVVVKRPVHAPPLGYDGDGVGVMVPTTDETGEKRRKEREKIVV